MMKDIPQNEVKSMGVWDYFTPEQQEKLKKRMEQFSQEELMKMRTESNEVLSKLITGFEEGIPPENTEIIRLAKLLAESQAVFNNEDPEIEKAVERFHLENPTKKDHGMDLKIYQYIEKAKSYSSKTSS
ncbi:TipAS antibiotic-recognition domain-containing protein [Pseudalkalibacillus salsuginis]|uniref:TipAS antibiotic-recognition domain-containing protein n=1 Tax=Pseudalkalibacillus salsuginis TaxID=2910972 RepID=UPI001F2D78AB|nr:TipAS antibiotic-recognition domain-containing protein [Pseudalkalibacillus salsuginis]MCF6410374.1 TipAS antibiotic-recognition domain-containing protein [Pseudalkalibacillus salsuginis]